MKLVQILEGATPAILSFNKKPIKFSFSDGMQIIPKGTFMEVALTSHTFPGAVEIHFERNEQDYLTVSMDTVGYIFAP